MSRIEQRICFLLAGCQGPVGWWRPACQEQFVPTFPLHERRSRLASPSTPCQETSRLRRFLCPGAIADIATGTSTSSNASWDTCNNHWQCVAIAARKVLFDAHCVGSLLSVCYPIATGDMASTNSCKVPALALKQRDAQRRLGVFDWPCCACAA